MVRRPKGKTARDALREMEWGSTRRYVELRRAAGDLLSVGDTDFDLRELVDRRFACDSRKCLTFRGGKLLVDQSCCARYRIEMTSLDRERLQQVLPLVRERLPEDHALQDEDEPPWVSDEDFRVVMAEDDRGVCPFVLYRDGTSACAIHAACLDEGLDPWQHKPLACCLWPLATLQYRASDGRAGAYRVDGGVRTLVTAYGPNTNGLWADDDDDYDRCACLVDRSTDLPPLYQAQREILEQVFGAGLIAKLDAAARQRARRRR